MKINVDRLATLAGINPTENILSEGKGHGEDTDEYAYEAADSEKEALEEDLDEVIEIDEKVLVQELRRAKHMIAESKARKENLQEAELKRIISSEISNVLKDLNLNSGWVYGNNRPNKSRAGYTHQGSYLKGLGFK